VEVHAQIMDAVLSGRLLNPIPAWLLYGLLFLSSVFAAILFREIRRWTAVVLVLALLAGTYLAGWIVYALSSWMLNPGPLLISIVVAPIVVQGDRLFEVNRRLGQQVNELTKWLRRHGWHDTGDLTDNVAMLQQLQAELGSLYELHDNLLQASSDAVGVFDAGGKLLLQNGAFAKLFGSAPCASKISQIHAQLRWTQDAPETAAAQGYEGEARVGDDLFAVRTVPIGATRLSPVGGSLMLLTSLKTREERDASRAEALGFVTHELRTPLTSIQGFAELMMQHPESPACQTAPNIIHRESKRLLALIHSYLDVLRMDAGARPIQASTFAIGEVVDNVQQLLRPVANEDRMTLRSDGDPSVMIMADRALMEGAILNLLTNAIKYGDPGSAIRVSWAADNYYADITVCNRTQHNVDSEISAMFEPFHRGPNVRSSKGWGIGLALVKRIAEKHGGSVNAQSQQGMIQFTIHLPIRGKVLAATETSR
jgi:signal transduction histidine kinase